VVEKYGYIQMSSFLTNISSNMFDRPILGTRW